MTVWGQRSVEHHSKNARPTVTAGTDSEYADATPSQSWYPDDRDYAPPDLPCHIIPQEPGSCYIGSLNTARTCAGHTTAGVHTTVSLRTDIYTGRAPTTKDMLDWYVRDTVNSAVARFLFRRQPFMPNLTDAILVVKQLASPALKTCRSAYIPYTTPSILTATRPSH